jgi:hypothetical protein
MGIALIILAVALIITIVAHIAWYVGGQENPTLNAIARASLIAAGVIVFLIALSKRV